MRFSIVIPIYNGAKTLAETLLSVKNQSFTDWEIVAVNDGSTDDSATVFFDTTRNWPHVKWMDQTNRGLGNARNEAVKNAVGEWLVFLDADDLWAPNKLAEIEQALRANQEADVIYHAIFELNKNGLLRKRNFVPVKNTAEFIALGNPFVPSAMAIKKSVYEKNGGFIEDRNQVEDLLLWFRLLAAKTTFLALDKPLTMYRMGAGVTSNLTDHLQKVQCALENAHVEKLVSDVQKTQFEARKNYEAARQLHKLGDFINAATFYKKRSGSSFKTQVLAFLCRLKIAL